MRRTKSRRRNPKLLKRKKWFLSSAKGVSHVSQRAKRRLCCKIQLWMWRKRREKHHYVMFRTKKTACVIGEKTQSQKNKSNGENSAAASPLGESAVLPETAVASATDANVSVGETVAAQRTETLAQLCKNNNLLKEESIVCKKTEAAETDASLLTKDIHKFLDDFHRIYGSFIPLQKSDVLRHLEGKFNASFSHRKNIVFSEVKRRRAAMAETPAPSFQVIYRKHSLTLDDLSTLADQNWLNDQVMNMYGELIMESACHKVHFLNSFFHRQLMTRGYDGVRRWTKQVDLFGKSLLLVPVHLEVHWCLVTADISTKKICLYDSQGNALQKVARNILKYLMTEAKEKKQTAFQSGWAVSFDEVFPRQTNENDCGVFVLEYSRCLALGKPLQFSQKDIPKIRKRIYKELCDCKLHEHG